jgi:hypothetical protein
MADNLTETDGAATRPRALPPLYRRPAVVDAKRHANMSLKEAAGYGFARTIHALPLNLAEFPAAARFYPIVFAGDGENTIPVAIMGVRTNQNLYVSETGEWASGVYVPAYVRRYPFIFMESSDKTKLGLCIDEASEALVESDVRPLFRAGKRTEIVEKAIEFCMMYQREYQVTRAFTDAVVEAGLLRENQAEVRFKTGERLAVSGFRVIDEGKLNTLTDEKFLEWRKRNWLAPVYCHFVSGLSWTTLIDRAVETGHVSQ